jgi:hypothetical protein
MTIIGLSVPDFTTLHVIISLIGIATGLVALFFMLRSNKSEKWTAVFLISTVLTSVTGFMFQSERIGPPHVVGALSLVVLALCLAAFYGYRLAGRWRMAYVITALVALYFNCFVGVVQAFQKLEFLQPLAPTQTEPPFAIAQGVVLVFFIAVGVLAVKKFHPELKPA